MKKTAFVLGLLALVAFGARAFAQTEQDTEKKLRELQSKFEDMNRRQTNLEAINASLVRENADLKGRVDKIDTSAGENFETAVNAMADSMLDGGATVKSGANPITFTGEARIRAAYTNDRDFNANFANDEDEDDNGTFIDQRFNLGFDFTIDQHVSTHFEMISTGLWDNGSPNPHNSDLAEVDLYQGWILINGMFGRQELGTRFGRQEIVLGNEFIFGNNDFFAGETHDALLLWWNDENFRTIFVWAKFDTQDQFNASGHPYNAFGRGFGYDDDEAYVLYNTLKCIKGHEIDFYYAYWNGHGGTTQGTLGNVIGAGMQVYAHLLGLRIGGEFDVAAGLDYNVEVAYEFGGLDGTNIDVDGLTSEGTIGLTFSKDSLARLYFMYIYAEGFDGNDTGFVPLYPERHAQIDWSNNQKRIARWGLMDIMPMDNIIAFQLGFTFRPNPDWILGIDGIYGWHDEDVVTTTQTLEDGIGGEIDLFAEHRMNDKTTLGFGLGVFLPDEGANLEGATILNNLYAGNGVDDPAFMFYTQVRVTF